MTPFGKSLIVSHFHSQVDHKQACFRDETFDFSKELMLESQRVAAERDAESNNDCNLDTKNSMVDKKPGSGPGSNEINSIENEDWKLTSSPTDTKVEEHQEKMGEEEAEREEGEEEKEEEEEESESEGKEDDHIEHCRTPTVILTPTKAIGNLRSLPDVIEKCRRSDLQNKKMPIESKGKH